MRKFAPLDRTPADVAEIGAFKDMALCAIRSLLTVAKEAKSFANRGGGRGLAVGKGTLSLCTVSFGIVQTIWDTFSRKVVGKIA